MGVGAAAVAARILKIRVEVMQRYGYLIKAGTCKYRRVYQDSYYYGSRLIVKPMTRMLSAKALSTVTFYGDLL